jgi:hypothetical protein
MIGTTYNAAHRSADNANIATSIGKIATKE